MTTPEDRVRLFMTALNEWERTAPRIIVSGTREEKASMRAALEAIYAEHVSAKGRGPKRFGRNLLGPGPSAEEPPRYHDDDVISVEPASKKSTVYVVTKGQRQPHRRWRFTVVLDDAGDAKIDDLHGGFAYSGEVQEWKSFGY
jgi:hypothetical protein